MTIDDTRDRLIRLEAIVEKSNEEARKELAVIAKEFKSFREDIRQHMEDMRKREEAKLEEEKLKLESIITAQKNRARHVLIGFGIITSVYAAAEVLGEGAAQGVYKILTLLGKVVH